MQRTLELHIDELILEGFPLRDRYQIGAAVERELTRLFVENGIAPSFATGGHTGSLYSGSFDFYAGASPEVTGSRIAQSIYDSIDVF